MTVESYYVIVPATLSDWLKDSRQFFSQWESKPKPIAPCTRDFSRASSDLQIIARNCDWFIALFVTVVIGRSSCFGFGLSTVIWKPLYTLDSSILPLNNWDQDNTRKGDQHRWFLSLRLLFFFSVFCSWVQFYEICCFGLNSSSQKHLLILLIWCTTRTQKSGKCVIRPWTSSWYFTFKAFLFKTIIERSPSS